MRKHMRIALLAALAGGTAGQVWAAAKDLAADQDFDEVNSFSLQFAGAPTPASDISFTQFDVEVDAATGTARFTDYYQEVGAVLLPLPTGDFISTGDLIIEIVPGSSQGTFDAATGEFNTFDLYAIHFTGDLSAFGFQSPVILPGDSLGVILNADAGLTAGDINLDWAGDGELPNPVDPLSTIPFNYTCSTRTNFSDGLRCGGACPGDTNRDCNVNFDDLLIVLGNFSEAQFYTTPRRGDHDADLDVDLDDVLVTLGNFGAQCQ